MTEQHPRDELEKLLYEARLDTLTKSVMVILAIICLGISIWLLWGYGWKLFAGLFFWTFSNNLVRSWGSAKI